MTYEEYITKHNLHLDLTWKGFEVKNAGKARNAWPCFKWQYHVTVGNDRVALIEDYTQGIGHGKWHGLLAGESRNRGSIAYDPKVGLYFKLHSGGCYPVVTQGEGKPYGEKAELPKRPYFQFEDPDCRFKGPQYFVNRPTFPNILDSLRTDAECAYPTFEEFADSCGYDSDSRSAEKLYLACCETERKLRGLVGWKGMVELLEEVERL